MTPASAPLLSLCMIVKNEAAVLARCLASVRGLAEEVIVVDTGSTDGTVELAQAQGATVCRMEWQDDFALARNRALEQAHGRWILVLDADEYLLDTDRNLLSELLATATPDQGFELLMKTLDGENRVADCVPLIRVFPNRPEIRFEGPIHEVVGPSLARAGCRAVATSISIMHTGYADPETLRRKEIRNKNLLLGYLARHDGKMPGELWYHLGCCHRIAQEFTPALECFEKTRQDALVRQDGRLRQAAELSLAQILISQRRFAEAAALLPGAEPPRLGSPLPDWHPAIFGLKAALASEKGDFDQARGWAEAILCSEEKPWLPPVSWPGMKAEALRFLANYWHRRKELEVAVPLLRHAVRLSREKGSFTAAQLRECYASRLN